MKKYLYFVVGTMLRGPTIIVLFFVGNGLKPFYSIELRSQTDGKYTAK